MAKNKNKNKQELVWHNMRMAFHLTEAMTDERAN
jgi:hypothetical protein